MLRVDLITHQSCKQQSGVKDYVYDTAPSCLLLCVDMLDRSLGSNVEKHAGLQLKALTRVQNHLHAIIDR